MVVYRNGRSKRCSTRNSKRTLRTANSKPNLKRLSALLIGGLGMSLITSPAVSQQAQPRQSSEEIKADRPKPGTRREARQRSAEREGRRRGRMLWEQHPTSVQSKSEGAAAAALFDEDNPPLLLVDTRFWSKPTFVDIDGDSDLDVFVGEYRFGSIVYYENTGDATNPDFAAGISSPFGIGTLGYFTYPAPAFADIDGDGDMDLFVGDYYGDIHYFENTQGTDPTSPPAFALDSSNPFGLTNVSGNGATPDFVDIDFDGDMDLFVGNEYGQIIYFENTQGTDTTSPPAFAAMSTNPFGFVSVATYSAPAFADIDNDGDFDAFVGYADGDTYFFENLGDSASADFSGPSVKTPFGLTDVIANAAPAFADLDGDNDVDIALGAQNGFVHYYRNTDTSTNHSSPAFDPLWPFGISLVDRDTSPTFADLDGDGDLDALIGENRGDLLYFANSGDPTNPAFSTAPQRNPFGLSDVGTSPAPTFVDLNNDGLIDVVVGEGPDTFFFENVGNTSAPSFTAPVTGAFGLEATLTKNGTIPTFVDIDGDGDLDYFAGKLTSSLSGQGMFFQENTQGTATTSPPAFAAISNNPFGLAGMPDELAPAFADVDSDGDFDLIVGGDFGDLTYFENTGSPTSPAFASGVVNPSALRRFAASSRPTFADIDANGSPDLFSGMRQGELAYFENLKLPDKLLVSPKVFLEGPYSDPANAMTTGINSVLPLSQPYNGAEFSTTPLAYAGSESVGAMPANVVDWVLVQIRTGTPPSSQTLVDTRAAFLLSDGSVVDLDGSSPVSFVNKPIGDYHVIVFHRNHLGIMTLSTVALSAANTSYNFTTGSSQAFGASPMTEVEAGVWGMFAGDANVDGQVTAADFNEWLADTKAVKTGYQPTDFSLDAGVTATDFNVWLANTKAVASGKVPPLP